jgi:hypothetical protein
MLQINHYLLHLVDLAFIYFTSTVHLTVTDKGISSVFFNKAQSSLDLYNPNQLIGYWKGLFAN